MDKHKDKRLETEKVENTSNRPSFPKRALITGGMPYGNKELHFGHIGGVFIHADVYARFLRDRIGSSNVIFVSGTDCYGSTIEASFEKAKIEENYQGDIYDYVMMNHLKQKETLEKYQISLDLYGTSALLREGEVHKEVSNEVFDKLYNTNYLKIMKTKQFYDEDLSMFLNGRQVIGRCPIRGCKSDKAYADECSLGHQYNANELIQPISTLTGKTPILKEVNNWYFDLLAFRKELEERNSYLSELPNVRESLLKAMNEFLKDPEIYVKNESLDLIYSIKAQLPECEIIAEDQKSSFLMRFHTLDDRDNACTILSTHGIRYRTGKTLVPFRISGNAKWGIEVPEKDGVSGLTFWVWPESLWAPISFTKAYLEANADKHQNMNWKDWWNSKDAIVYQFIGEDNIYFYGIAEMGMFMALNDLKLPHLVANYHLLYAKTKASSSGDKKPPMAAELLEYYTPEELRMHFINASLGEHSVSFEPKAFMTKDLKGYDPVLNEGALLTNIYNRLVRSCIYTCQKYYNSLLPCGEISKEVVEEANKVILEYELFMYQYKFDKIFELLNVYLRDANKNWSAKSKIADTEEDEVVRKQLLVDSVHVVRTAMILLHPFAPAGCDKIKDYFNVNEKIYSWDSVFEPIYYFMEDSSYPIKFLEPRVDFFIKHESKLT